MSTPKIIGIVIAAFILGIIVAPKTKVETKTVIDEGREKTWIQLKQVDDDAITLAKEGFGYCSDFATAVSDLDPEAMKTAGDKLEELAPKVQDVATQRQVIIKNLGL